MQKAELEKENERLRDENTLLKLRFMNMQNDINRSIERYGFYEVQL